MTDEELFPTIGRLVEAWCDRRALNALRRVLGGYPLANQSTEDWVLLMNALKDVRAFARDQITLEELRAIDDCVRIVETRIYRI